MSYKIAVGSSDGKNVDLKFGEVQKFLIFTVDGKDASFTEIRPVKHTTDDPVITSCQGCGDGSGGGCGAGNGAGCGGPQGVSDTVELISDCRCVVCKKVGFQAQKQFEKKAISVFDVECPIRTALDKISFYYDRVDNHQSLRRK